MRIQMPLLSVAFHWESRVWQSHGWQHRQAAGEVKSSKTGASLKFTHYDQDKEAQIAEDSGETDGRCEVGGYGDGGIREPQRNSQHCTNRNSCYLDHTPMEDVKERLRYEDDPDSIKTSVVEKCSKEATDVGLGESMSSDAIQDIKQTITSNIFTLSATMTTFGECSQCFMLNQNNSFDRNNNYFYFLVSVHFF